MEKKELKFSAKAIRDFIIFMGIIVLCAVIGGALIGMQEYGVDGFFEILLHKAFRSWVGIYLVVLVGFVLVYLYQRKNNVLEFGNYGFQVKGNTYAYTQVTKLVARHRGNRDTSYHLYVGDEIVFKFSHYYENKDEFVEYLQRNGVQIIL